MTRSVAETRGEGRTGKKEEKKIHFFRAPHFDGISYADADLWEIVIDVGI